jgi:hypothetical protein
VIVYCDDCGDLFDGDLLVESPCCGAAGYQADYLDPAEDYEEDWTAEDLMFR